MKQSFLIFALILSVCSCKEKQTKTTELASAMKGVSQWFEAWELVSNEIYELDIYEPVDFVFFDKQYVYSTSSKTTKNGIEIKGPKIFDKKLTWFKAEHNGMITLPTGEVVPVNLMVFASPLDSKRVNSFFIMPLEDIWKSMGVKTELDYFNFLTGIFLHEFSHTQQMNGIGAKITEISKRVDFEENLTDEIVQTIFSTDSNYVSAFEIEHSSIFNIVQEMKSDGVKEILDLIDERQKKYFTHKYSVLKDLNPLFMTMEGVGQFTMYCWLKHPKGGNLKETEAIKGTRTKSWVQDEGFGLALLLSYYKKPKDWASEVFGGNSATLVELLEEAI